MIKAIEAYFKLKKNKTDFKTELLAGLTTFLASAYIIIIHPSVLSDAGMPYTALVTTTILVSAFSSILMGIYAKNPILVAPGMGINAFFTYSLVIGMKIPWPTALGAVFWSGIIFLILSAFNIRKALIEAIPLQLRYAISVGIGLFIAFIGLTKSGFVVSHPVTILTKGELTAQSTLFLIGLLITSIFLIKKMKGALILGVFCTTFLAFGVGRFYGGPEQLMALPRLLSWPDFSLLFKLDLIGSLKLSFIPIMFAFLFTDLFDSLSTFIGVCEAGNLLDRQGNPQNIEKSLISDAMATIMAGLFGSSSGTAFIESAAGIEQGGKTGLTAVVAGLLFLPFMFFSPLIGSIPNMATAPVLVLVGVFMMKPILKIKWNNLEDAIPSFIALLFIPATFSITYGIIWGFLSWTIIRVVQGKFQEIHPLMYIINICSILAVL